MYSWLKFKQYFAHWHAAYEQGKSIDIGMSGESFAANIERSIREAKVFEVDDVTKMLLLLSDPPNKNDDINLPFPYTFIDFTLTKKEADSLGVEMDCDSVIGIVVSHGNLYLQPRTQQDPSQTLVGRDLRITTLSVTNQECSFNTFIENLNLHEGYKDVKVAHVRQRGYGAGTRKIIHLFVLNFLNYLNNPEVETVTVKRSQKNMERRKREGKAPLPDEHISILVHGVVKRYMGYVRDAIKRGVLVGKHWTRGHYRRLMSDRYRVKKTIWIMPYIRGNPEGEEMLKHYRLVSKTDGE